MSTESLSVAEAASRLGVNQARVRAMIAAGLLDAVKISGRWLIPSSSLDRCKECVRPVGRPFSPANAWGLLMVAVGERPEWVSPWDLSRIRRRLREHGLVALAPTLRRRAVGHRFRAHPSDLERIRTEVDVIRTGVSAAGDHHLDILAPGQTEVYVPEETLRAVTKRYALQRSQRPNVLLRAVADLWPFDRSSSVAPASVVGVDLLDAEDGRTRRAGERLLEQVEVKWLT